MSSPFAFTEWLFVRLLAVVYFIAFVSFGVQAAGLIGAQGILPYARYLGFVEQTLGRAGYWDVPTVLWLNRSDAALIVVCVTGTAVSIVLMLGLFQRACLAALYVLYLSVCSAGQDFFSFQWDMLLLETGFLAIFLGSSPFIIGMFRFLLFRLMFLSGAVKLLSHDPAWRNLTAMDFHYWTQPLPTPVAWYISQFPLEFQKASTAGVFFVELAVPFFVFAPRRLRMAAGFLLIGLQVLIFLTGNYTFFNLLTMLLCLLLFDDRALAWLRGNAPFALHTPKRLAKAVTIVLVILGMVQIANTLTGGVPEPAATVLRVTGPYGIVNSYGLFAVMTTARPEIILQGSEDGANWKDYQFRFKPGDPRQAPRWVAPYQPRLDWQMWFAALSNWRANPWFAPFVLGLLRGSQPVTAQLAENPFPKQPPKFVRALLFDYRFTSWAERSATGNWWKREPKGEYFPAVSLSDFKAP